MHRTLTTLFGAASRLRRIDAPLTLTGLAMLPVLTWALAGLVLDPRLIAGAPAWLKPAKFAASAAVYSLTLAWIFSYLPAWTRTRRLVGRTTAGVFVLEVALVCLQAWRGTTSHFNVATPADGLVFGVMGLAIAAQTAASAFVLIALWRQPFTDRAMGTALRAAMLITLLGAASAGFMTRPTAAQMQDIAAGRVPAAAGAHTVGGPDGGPGLPGTGWSTAHGDLRVPHFVGLHALQVLPLVALWLRRRSDDEARAVRRAAASYSALFGLLLWQALRGEALFAPGPVTSILFVAWAALSIAALWLVTAARRSNTWEAAGDSAPVY